MYIYIYIYTYIYLNICMYIYVYIYIYIYPTSSAPNRRSTGGDNDRVTANKGGKPGIPPQNKPKKTEESNPLSEYEGIYIYMYVCIDMSKCKQIYSIFTYKYMY
jgi:hypothetical protein